MLTEFRLQLRPLATSTVNASSSLVPVQLERFAPHRACLFVWADITAKSLDLEDLISLLQRTRVISAALPPAPGVGGDGQPPDGPEPPGPGGAGEQTGVPMGVFFTPQSLTFPGVAVV
jgi:hypothetical protein